MCHSQTATRKITSDYVWLCKSLDTYFLYIEAVPNNRKRSWTANSKIAPHTVWSNKDPAAPRGAHMSTEHRTKPRERLHRDEDKPVKKDGSNGDTQA